MDKKNLHHFWTKIRRVRPWYFFVIFVVSGTVFLFAVRHNYATMVNLRNAVYQADKENGDVKTALKNLQNYVYNHMNTSVASGPNAVYPPIQLKYTYDNLVKAQASEVARENSQIYTDAQHYCEAKIPTGFSGRYRISCIQNYVTRHGTKTTPIPDSLYKFDFVAARWSPDLAGLSLIVTILSFLIFVALLLINRWLKSAVA